MIEVVIPDVGESIVEAYVASWLKKPGEAVTQDEPLFEIETDKATLEVPAPASGVITEVLKDGGELVRVGDVVAYIDESQAADAAAPAAPTAPQGDPDAEDAELSEPASGAAKPIPMPQAEAVVVMPAAQRLIEEHGLEAQEIPPSGPGGRLLKEDVLSFIDAQDAAPGAESITEPSPPAPSPNTPAPPAPKPPTPRSEEPNRVSAPESTLGTDGREEEAVPMSLLRRRIAERLVEAQRSAALLTTFNEVDMSAVMALRSDYKEAFQARYEGVRLGFMSFFVKAAIDALKQFPQLNAEIQGDHILYKNYFDIGVAVSSQKGLLVPVLRNAERLSFAEIERTISDFGKRAQSNKIKPDELQGGTFTITNGGVFGSLLSTPIVNPPQSGVLGMHGIFERPVALKGEVVIRPMMYIALTYDHRIVDGREAVTFLKRVKEAIEAPARMLLEV